MGEYIDEWGCRFINRQRGLIGEMKEPLIKGEEWEDLAALKLPEELLDINRDKINEFCKNTDKFVLPNTCPRIFERLQFVRGSEQLYVDLMLQPKGFLDAVEMIHDFYCRELTAWAGTNVDALTIMDDWGSQRGLLINPKMWNVIFKPIYRDYIDIAHKHGKKILMHSDGFILDIIPHLIDLGLDAVNSQLFCMGVENLRQFKGKITFWGEMDRQQILPFGSGEDVRKAVRRQAQALLKAGRSGVIAQCEFGINDPTENVLTVFDEWDKISAE
jgi:uroporphyrinogen-III decarboxylase